MTRSSFVALLLCVAAATPSTAEEAIQPPMKLMPNDPRSMAEFGNSVSIDGDWAVVGAQHDDYGGSPSGAAYIFHRTASGWEQTEKLTSGNPDDAFGLSVAISGRFVVVGAWFADGATGGDGAAYVFERDRYSGAWTLAAKLTQGDQGGGGFPFNDHFGFAVAIERNTIVVGAPIGDSIADDNTGAAYVFQRGDDGAWRQVAKLWAADAVRGAQFGESVAISSCTALIGSPWASGPDFQSGAAYVFDACATGEWQQVARFSSGDPASRFFGTSVDIDRDSAVVGANANNDFGTFTGAAYVFTRPENAPAAWTRIAKLSAMDAERDKNFGYSVAIDRSTIVVGAPGDDHAGFQSGAAYVFRRNDAHVALVAKLTAPDARGFDTFAWSVAVSEGAILVGSPEADVVPFNSGAAYVFALPTVDPVCRIDAEAIGDVVVLDVRLATPFPVTWSVWASVNGSSLLLWSRDLPVMTSPLELSLTLPRWPSASNTWLASMFSTRQTGLVCRDLERVGGK